MKPKSLPFRAGYAASLLALTVLLNPTRTWSQSDQVLHTLYAWVLHNAPDESSTVTFRNLDISLPANASFAIQLASRFAPSIHIYANAQGPLSATAFLRLAGNDRGPETLKDISTEIDRLQNIIHSLDKERANLLASLKRRSLSDSEKWDTSNRIRSTEMQINGLEHQARLLHRRLWVHVQCEPEALFPTHTDPAHSPVWTLFTKNVTDVRSAKEKQEGTLYELMCGLQSGYAYDLESPNAFGDLDLPVGYVRIARMTGERVDKLITPEQQMYSLQYLLLFPNNDVSCHHPIVDGDFSQYDHEGDWLCIDYTVSMPALSGIGATTAIEKAQFHGVILHNHGRQFFLHPDYWPEGSPQRAGRSIDFWLEKGTQEPWPVRGAGPPEAWPGNSNVRVNESPLERMRKLYYGPARLGGERNVVHAHEGSLTPPILWQVVPCPPEDRSRGADLHLLSVSALSEIPANGSLLVVVARNVADENRLYFKVFDANERGLVDCGEPGFQEKLTQLEELKDRLDSLWDARILSDHQQDAILDAVNAITGHPGSQYDTGPSPPLGVWLLPENPSQGIPMHQTDGWLLWAYPGTWGDSIGKGDSPRSPYFNPKMASREFRGVLGKFDPGPSDGEVVSWFFLLFPLPLAAFVLLYLQFAWGSWGGNKGDGNDGRNSRGQGDGAKGRGNLVLPAGMLPLPPGAGEGAPSFFGVISTDGTVEVCWSETPADVFPVAKIIGWCDDGTTRSWPPEGLDRWVWMSIESEGHDLPRPAFGYATYLDGKTEVTMRIPLGERGVEPLTEVYARKQAMKNGEPVYGPCPCDDPRVDGTLLTWLRTGEPWINYEAPEGSDRVFRTDIVAYSFTYPSQTDTTWFAVFPGEPADDTRGNDSTAYRAQDKAEPLLQFHAPTAWEAEARDYVLSTPGRVGLAKREDDGHVVFLVEAGDPTPGMVRNTIWLIAPGESPQRISDPVFADLESVDAAAVADQALIKVEYVEEGGLGFARFRPSRYEAIESHRIHEHASVDYTLREPCSDCVRLTVRKDAVGLLVVPVNLGDAGWPGPTYRVR